MDGWNIKSTGGQLANSSNMNMNDLSSFQALQSGQCDSVEEANQNRDWQVGAVTAHCKVLTK